MLHSQSTTVQAALTNTYAIVFNGPPRAGKDTAAKWLMLDWEDCTNIKVIFDRFSMPLKASVASWAGTEVTDEGECWMEQHKDEDIPELLGNSYRRAQIQLFQYLEARYGEDVLGKFLVNRMVTRAEEMKDVKPRGRPIVYLIPDGGRGCELEYLRDALPSGHLLVVQVTADGCNFDKDIRKFVDLANATTIQVHNSKNGIPEYVTRIREMALIWFRGIKHR